MGKRDAALVYATPWVPFSSADMDKYIKMALHGRLEEQMVNIVTQIYRQNVIYEKGSPVLYVTLNNDPYG